LEHTFYLAGPQPDFEEILEDPRAIEENIFRSVLKQHVSELKEEFPECWRENWMLLQRRLQ
jgi:hypothetical protein